MKQINLEGVLDDVSAVSLEQEEITVKVMKTMIITETPADELPSRLLVKTGDDEIQRYANISRLPPEVNRVVTAASQGVFSELKSAADSLVKRLEEIKGE